MLLNVSIKYWVKGLNKKGQSLQIWFLFCHYRVVICALCRFWDFCVISCLRCHVVVLCSFPCWLVLPRCVSLSCKACLPLCVYSPCVFLVLCYLMFAVCVDGSVPCALSVPFVFAFCLFVSSINPLHIDPPRLASFQLQQLKMVWSVDWFFFFFLQISYTQADDFCLYI